MAKLAMVATVEIAPGRRDAVMPFMIANRARSLADGPGASQFELLWPHDDENAVRSPSERAR